jgi:hypothetical protein
MNRKYSIIIGLLTVGSMICIVYAIVQKAQADKSKNAAAAVQTLVDNQNDRARMNEQRMLFKIDSLQAALDSILKTQGKK